MLYREVTAETYDQVLDRIDQLMDVEPDTDEAKELVFLVEMVMEYETLHYPMGDE